GVLPDAPRRLGDGAGLVLGLRTRLALQVGVGRPRATPPERADDEEEQRQRGEFERLVGGAEATGQVHEDGTEEDGDLDERRQPGCQPDGEEQPAADVGEGGVVHQQAGDQEAVALRLGHEVEVGHRVGEEEAAANDERQPEVDANDIEGFGAVDVEPPARARQGIHGRREVRGEEPGRRFECHTLCGVSVEGGGGAAPLVRLRVLASHPPATPLLPPRLVNRREKAALVLDRLRERIPRPETELRYRTPFELLVAVILSAQCTDARVNLVTPALFERFPTPEAMAGADADEILPYIRSVSYPNNKAKALAATARMLVEEFGGEVPSTHAELMRLKGVGRKTANVIVAVAFDEPAIAVDTHVFRVANRIGLVKDAPTPRAVEDGLARVIPRADWGEAHHLLILHGRYVCTARAPRHDACPLTD